MVYDDTSLKQAAKWVANAEALFIGAGAGMGVDSRLPDFRGTQGFWQAYPLAGKSKIRFELLANGELFREDPRCGWWFYGHRLELYRQTRPHSGFELLRNWITERDGRGFIFTSNVDGQFQKVGFDDQQINECHGSIHHLQCAFECHDGIWPAGELTFTRREDMMSVDGEIPRCPVCQRAARPNILMFDDGYWVGDRTDAQHVQMKQWLEMKADRKCVAIELGAGGAILTVRHLCENLGMPLIRINPRESGVPPHGIGLSMGALDALQQIQEHINGSSR